VKICVTKSKYFPQNKVKVQVILSNQICNVLSLNDKVKILDFLKGGMLLATVGWHHGKNKSSTHSTVLNYMHSEHSQYFLNDGLLGTIDMQLSWVYSVL
jgi:hypothetical protein